MSVCAFLMFGKRTWKSQWLNRVAKHTVAIYLFEGAVHALLDQWIHLEKFAGSPLLFFVILLECVIAGALGILVDVFLDWTIFDMFNYKLAEIAHELDKVNLNELTPIDAMNTLARIKEKMKPLLVKMES